MLITIAIPCYKSSQSLPVVVEQIRSQFSQQTTHHYQIVLVNDSPDHPETQHTIEDLCANDKRIVGIELSRNFGQAAAKMAAIPFVEGDVLVYMDDDGQHDAAGIFPLVEAIEQGADMAIAAFQGKKHTWLKKMASNINSHLLCLTLGKPKDIRTSSFAAYSRFIIERLKTYQSPFVSMFGFTLQNTRRIVNVSLDHHKRLVGTSGYTLKKMLRLWGDVIVSFSTRPIQLIGVMGGIFTALGVILLLIGLVAQLSQAPLPGVHLPGYLFLAAGMILFAQALLGAYIGRIYLTQNQQPQYVIRMVLNDLKKESDL